MASAISALMRRVTSSSQSSDTFTAEVLDTWNMTTTAVPGTFTLVKKTDYFHADKDGRRIELPGRPYMAIRIKRVSVK